MKFEQRTYLERWWRSIDQSIIFALSIIFAFSLMLVTTSGPAVATRIGLDEHYFIIRQAIYLFLGAFCILGISYLEKKWIKRFAIVGFMINLSLLPFVKLWGYEVKGATRWLSIFGFSLQPSEFIKPFFAVVVAWILSINSDTQSNKNSVELKTNLICLLLYLILSVLIIIQPDFGMLVMITAVFGIQLFVSGISWFIILLISTFTIVGAFGAYFFLPHVRNRVETFLDPTRSENYQVNKSIIAFQHGGFYGRGPGEGAIKEVLPDSHTDFIFAVAGEEFGAIICLVMMAAFLFIILKSISIIIKTEDKFIQIAATGITVQFALQSIINMGVTLNLLPTKGMTLPFISYGGCSTLAVSIGIGMLLGFLRRTTSLTKYKLKFDE